MIGYVATYLNNGVSSVGVGRPATTFPSMYLRGTFNGWTKASGHGAPRPKYLDAFSIKTVADCFKFDVLGDGTTNFGGVNATSGTAIQGGANICPQLEPGEYTVTLNDSTHVFSVDQPMATNQAPIANAGSPITTTIGTPVMFDGTASSDADGYNRLIQLGKQRLSEAADRGLAHVHLHRSR